MSWRRVMVGEADITFKTDKVEGKGRPRFDSRRGVTYTPSETKAAEEEIAWIFRSQYGGRWSRFDGEVEIYVSYCRQLAKSNPAKWEGRADLGKPDCDNVLKLIMDALEGVAYKNDSQVTLAVIQKKSRVMHGNPNRIRVRLQYFNEEYTKEDSCNESS